MYKKPIERVMLIFPPMVDHALLEKHCCVPMGIAYLAAYLRDRYEVRLLDCVLEGYEERRDIGSMLVEYGLPDERTAAHIQEFQPDVVGISCLFSSSFGAVRRLSRLVKQINPEIITVTGGTHPSFLPEQCLRTSPDLDFIVIGEGEYTFKDLLEHISLGRDYRTIDGLAFRDDGRICINPRTRLIEPLDVLPYPARDLLPIEQYIEKRVPMAHTYRHPRNLSIATSRGCPFKCTFCSSTNHWRKYRKRSVENVLGEMDELYHRFGIRELKFEDDNLTADRKRAMALFQGMIDRGYNFTWNTPNGIATWTLDEEMVDMIAASGAYEVTLAIETGDQWVMDNIVKKPLQLELIKPTVERLRRRGIHVHAYLIFGLPGETIEQMRHTFNLMREVGIYRFFPFLYSPLPGSELFQVCVEKGLVDEDYDFERRNIYTKPPFEREDITQQELMDWILREYRRAQIRYVLHDPLGFFQEYRYAMSSAKRFLAKVMNFIRWQH